MAIPGEQYFKMSNAIFVYGLSPIQLSVYFYLCRCAGQRGSCQPRRRKLHITRPADKRQVSTIPLLVVSKLNPLTLGFNFGFNGG